MVSDRPSLDAYPSTLVHHDAAERGAAAKRDRGVVGRSERAERDPAAEREGRERDAGGKSLAGQRRAVRVAKLPSREAPVELDLDRAAALQGAAARLPQGGREPLRRATEPQ